MRTLLTISFLCLGMAARSQDNPAALAKQLTASTGSDKQKVISIFKWITNNISYTIFRKPVIPFSVDYTEPDEEAPLKPINERVALAVMKRRTALCDGYARLFKTLCDFAGIPSEIIQGYAKNNGNKPGSRFAVNHYWNAVFFDGEWHLLDATWASGYVSWRGDEFIKDYDGEYFLAAPGSFIKDHYPDDPRWTLLGDPVMPDEFHYSPFKLRSFAKYGIVSFSPAAGIIEAYVGDTIRLQLETMTEKGRMISPGMLVDSGFFDYSPSWVFLQPEEKDNSLQATGLHRYSFPVLSTATQWLYLIYNNDIVLKYKINVKTRKSS